MDPEVGKSSNLSLKIMHPNIENLPEEVLCIILSMLPIVDRVKCKRVNKRWESVSCQLFCNKLKLLNANPISWGMKPLGPKH